MRFLQTGLGLLGQVRGALAISVLAAATLSLAQGAWAADTLVEAARSGDTATALQLVRQKLDVNGTESDGTTALHWAIYRNDVTLVRALVSAGANVNAPNGFGSTPMSEAAIAGDAAVIRTLLKAGADPDSPNADGQTALMVLARTSNVEAATLLLKKRAKVNAVERLHGQSALMWAAAQSQPEMVKLLVEHGAAVDARSRVTHWQRQVTAEQRAQSRPPGGLTALLYAARQGCLKCVEVLQAARADLNMADPEGVTPLIIAITNFHFDIAAYLLEKGANPLKWDWWGRTPLYCAVDLNTIPHGGRPDRISLDATTSLKLIELLLAAGANPNAQLKLFPPYRALGPDRGGDMMLTIDATPLLRAAKAGDVPVIKLLLAHGADPNLPNIDGTTPVMAAAGQGSNEIDTRGRFKTEAEAVESINLLVAAGADVNAHETRVCVDNGYFCESGQTALHGAALLGWNEVVRTLVAHHADPNARDAKGMTPLDSALGRAGGHGMEGSRIEVHEGTAALIRELASARGVARCAGSMPPTSATEPDQPAATALACSPSTQ